LFNEKVKRKTKNPLLTEGIFFKALEVLLSLRSEDLFRSSLTSENDKVRNFFIGIRFLPSQE